MRRQFVLGIVFAAGVLTISVHALSSRRQPRASRHRVWSKSTS